MFNNGLKGGSLFSFKTSALSCQKKLNSGIESQNQYYSEFAESTYDPEDPSKGTAESMGSGHPTVFEGEDCYLFKLEGQFSSRRQWAMHINDSHKTGSNALETFGDAESFKFFNGQRFDGRDRGVPDFDSMTTLSNEHFGELWQTCGYPYGLVPMLQRNWSYYFYESFFVPCERFFLLVGEFFFH